MRLKSHGPDSEEPATTTASGAPTVPRLWLVDFEDTGEAQRLARLEADLRLVDRAMWAGYAGKDWEVIVERLVGYGLRVMTAWIVTGRIFSKCDSKGYGLERFDGPERREAAEDLAQETVAIAIVKFRDTVLIPRKWDPNRGASLSTFFIGQCLLRFPNVWRAWLPLGNHLADQRQLNECLVLSADHRVDRASRPSDPAQIVLDLVDAAEQLADVDPKTLEVAYYRHVCDYTWDEVADLTGLSVSAAKSRLYRLKEVS